MKKIQNDTGKMLEKSTKKFNEAYDELQKVEVSLSSAPDDDEIGPLSWDVMGRTKIQMQRSFFFVKRMENFQKKLGNEYPLIPLSHGMVLRTEGATL